jgi:hypothetical protein
VSRWQRAAGIALIVATLIVIGWLTVPLLP